MITEDQVINTEEMEKFMNQLFSEIKLDNKWILTKYKNNNQIENFIDYLPDQIDARIRWDFGLLNFTYIKNTYNFRSTICPEWNSINKRCDCHYTCGAYIPYKWDIRDDVIYFKICKSDNIEHTCSGYLIEAHESISLSYCRRLSNKHFRLFHFNIR